MDTNVLLLETPVFNVLLSGQPIACRAQVCKKAGHVVIRLQRVDGQPVDRPTIRAMAESSYQDQLPKRPMAQVFWLLDQLGLNIGPVSTGRE